MNHLAKVSLPNINEGRPQWSGGNLDEIRMKWGSYGNDLSSSPVCGDDDKDDLRTTWVQSVDNGDKMETN